MESRTKETGPGGEKMIYKDITNQKMTLYQIPTKRKKPKKAFHEAPEQRRYIHKNVSKKTHTKHFGPVVRTVITRERYSVSTPKSTIQTPTTKELYQFRDDNPNIFKKGPTEEPVLSSHNNGHTMQGKLKEFRRTKSIGGMSVFSSKNSRDESDLTNFSTSKPVNLGGGKGRDRRIHSFSGTRTDKQKLKQFTKRMQSFGTFAEALEFAKKSLTESYLPYYATWKVYTLIAEVARRHNKFDKARQWYEEAWKNSPSEPQIWMEYSKLEEECGRLDKCEEILLNGLSKCYLKDAIVIKLIKFYEQMNKVEESRKILSNCEKMAEKNPKRCWKIILEGAIMESKQGNIATARNFFRWLMRMAPHQGRIYMEAYKMEEKIGELDTALKVLLRGVEMVPKHAPLWYCLFHLHEKRGSKKEFRESVNLALENVTKEIRWKIYTEAATIEERMGDILAARELYVKAVNTGPENVRWKIWIAGARTELGSGETSFARMLLGRAIQATVPKNKFLVYLELAKLEEWKGNYEQARGYVLQARKQKKHEWKVYLEKILLELRVNNFSTAMKESKVALDLHPATGRLWSIYIRLNSHKGEEEQYRLFRKALKIVPKSGEVWCEGARLRMNPFSTKFNVRKAKEYLNFAIKFTPQYGDSFIEFIRAENLLKGQQLDDQKDKQHMQMLCVNADPNYGQLWFFCKKKKKQPIITVLERARTLIVCELNKEMNIYQKAIDCQDLPMSRKKEIIEKLRKDNEGKSFETALHSFFMEVEHNPEAKKLFIYQSIFADSLKKWI